jgi:hypothetical protein
MVALARAGSFVVYCGGDDEAPVLVGRLRPVS